jgi:glycosyltransferase involved in cell wall biosynthesis
MANSSRKARRVVHLTSVHPPFDVRIFHRECRSIAQAGYEVTLVAGHSADQIVDGVQLRAIKPRSRRIARMFGSTWAVWREAARANADLYHFHDPELIPVGLLMRLRNKQVVYDVHENVQADVACKHYIPRLLRRPLAWLVGFIEKNSSRYFSAIVPATTAIRQRFEFRSPTTVLVRNYPLLDEAPSEVIRPWRERRDFVVYAGLLSRDRCIQEIVEAMGLLPGKWSVRLKLAGTFSPPAYLSKLVANKGWHRTEMLGEIDRKKVACLLGEARAGLCVYRPDPNNLESSPNKLFEYMSAGLPVIASDFPAFRAIIDAVECGILVNPLEPGSIARAIEHIFDHPEEAERMGMRGRKAVAERFNWASEERKLLALYADLLEHCPGG